MAVEAHHLHLFPSQLLKNRAIADAAENQSILFDPHAALFAPSSATATFVPFYNPAAAAPAAAPAPSPAAADSGLTFNNFASASASASASAAAAAAAAAILSRKRPRDSSTRPVSFLGEDISPIIQQQMLDVDRLILYHAARVRAELIERRGRFARQIVAAAEEGLAKRLKAKEEELERMTKLNWALEEKVKSLCVENQIWRDLAQSNEAAANVLRTNLEHVLAAQSRIKQDENNDDADPAAAEDAESCCCGGNYAAAAAAEEEETKNDRRRRACRSCGEGEPTVLILPCRHLCLCAMCAPAIHSCPVCKSAKNGSMSVNMS